MTGSAATRVARTKGISTIAAVPEVPATETRAVTRQIPSRERFAPEPAKVPAAVSGRSREDDPTPVPEASVNRRARVEPAGTGAALSKSVTRALKSLKPGVPGLIVSA